MITLKDIGINETNKTYIIAEIGINHGGSLDKAKALIESASKTGCDAVKFQTYLTEKRAPKNKPEIFKILKDCELDFENFSDLKIYSESLGLDFFSTPFDIESVDYLESINTKLYKVASFDVENFLLLEYLAKLKKPIIMSCGMSSLEEIKNAVQKIKSYNEKIAILHCISSYPTNENEANLNTITTLCKNFEDCVVGQSDHTNGIKVPTYAVALGAKIIEKHFKIDERMECIDAPVSITEEQMRTMVADIRNLEKIMGESFLGISENQKETTVFRRKS